MRDVILLAVAWIVPSLLVLAALASRFVYDLWQRRRDEERWQRDQLFWAIILSQTDENLPPAERRRLWS